MVDLHCPKGPIFGRSRHGIHGLAGRKNRIGQISEVDERRLIAIAQLGMACAGRRILHHCDLETMLEQFAHASLDTEVRRHPRQDDLAYLALAELQDNVVVLRAIDFMGAGYDGFAVVNQWLVTFEPICS